MEKDNSCKTPRWRMLKSQLNNLTSKEFATAVTSLKDIVIIDVRTAVEYNSGHISNSINMDYLADDFLVKLNQLAKDKNYFIYCRSGRRSIRVCTWMRNGGFDNQNIYNLDKGYRDWLIHFPNKKTIKKR